ncbi:MAG: S-methyl-5'-thioadenosine phosphorylase [Cyanobacteria bacterium P01_C01_bin.89]
MTITIGILGGSGLYNLDALENVEERTVETPFGSPSDAIVTGKLNGVPVAFLARHGRNHHLLPSEVPYRANIYALKSLGVRYIVSVSAVGSLQDHAKPLDIVVPDQFMDRTKNRNSTFFGNGVVAHISFADPVCPVLHDLAVEAIASLDLPLTVHRSGTYLCMEGPAFSTKAESHTYRSWGATIIGMTNLPEAKLAREAEIAYTTLGMVTDYDCWHPDHGSVTVEMVIGNLMKNADNARSIIRVIVQRLGAEQPESTAHSALATSILTPLDKISPAARDRLALLLKPYL